MPRKRIVAEIFFLCATALSFVSAAQSFAAGYLIEGVAMTLGALALGFVTGKVLKAGESDDNGPVCPVCGKRGPIQLDTGRWYCIRCTHEWEVVWKRPEEGDEQ